MGRLDHRFGLPDAESRRDFGERVYQAVDAILEDEREYQVVVAAWLRISLTDAAWISFVATPGGITHLREDDRYQSRSLVFLNRAEHLDDA